MSRYQSSYLLALLLSILAARGLAAESMDPWRGWVAFKEFARRTAEMPDQGVSVQIAPADDRIHLFFGRQILVPERNRLEPAGAVVCEFEFAPRRRTAAGWQAWSFDCPTFERFVDLVEQHPPFADLLVTRPLRSAVYWEEL